MSEFQKSWDATEASAGLDPLPSGTYRCLVTDGRLFTSRANETPGFKVTFEVIDGPFAGRKAWHDIWLSSPALAMAKGELAKLGITSPDQLEQPLPPRLIADVKIVQRTADDGTMFNRVKTFKVIDRDVPADDYFPDDVVQEDSEANDDPDALDAGGFNWRTGVQVRHTSSVPLLDAVANGKGTTR
jgi:hypothetical protein